MADPAVQGIFEIAGRQVKCELSPGLLLTDAAEKAGIVLNVACGGIGTCGGCAVDLVEGTFATARGEEIALDGKPRRVLGCQTVVKQGPFRIRVPQHSIVTADEKVVVDFSHLPPFRLSPSAEKVHLKLAAPTLADQQGDLERILEALAAHGFGKEIQVPLAVLREAPAACRGGEYSITCTLNHQDGRWILTRLQSGDASARLFGLAVDVGTTTVVCSLVDLRAGKIIETASSYNQQVRRASDVASRISYAAAPEKLEELRRLIVDVTINRLIALLVRRASILAADIARVSIAGNTVMMHLLLGIDPAHLGAVPFQPATNIPGSLAAGDMGLELHPATRVELSPSRAAYIGGDVTADMVVASLASTDELTLLVDIGTNAEIVAGNRNRMIAAAAPAGPAFEGQGLSSGVRASAGAIDSVRIDPETLECHYTIIDGAGPVGLCGSAMIEFLAQAHQAGLINSAGRLDVARLRTTCPQRLAMVDLVGGNKAAAYVIVSAEETDDRMRPIIMSEADIAALLQAKGVIFAAIQIVMKHLGHSFADIQRVVLAGGFARHLDLDSVVAIGMLPDIPRQRYWFIGNGSLAGAFLRLVDSSVSETMLHLAEKPQVIELNLDADFQDDYVSAMFLPNLDETLFPSVRPA